MKLIVGDFSPREVFPFFILTSLLMKLKVNRPRKLAKQSIRQDSKDSRWPVHPSYKRTHEERESPQK